MITAVQKMYEGGALNQTGSVSMMFAPQSGTIKSIGIVIDDTREGGLPPVSDVYFNLTINGGAPLFAALNRPVIAGGEISGTLENLNIPVARFDRLIFSVENIPAGGVATPIGFEITIDDGESTGGGAALPAGDLNAATNKIEKIQGVTILLPANNSIDDNCEDFSKTIAHGTNLYSSSGEAIAGSGTGYFARNQTYNEPDTFVMYHAEGVQSVIITALKHVSQSEANFKVYKSADGANFTEITAGITEAVDPAFNGSWYLWNKTITGIQNASYIRINFSGGDNYTWNPELQRVRIITGTLADWDLIRYNAANNRFEKVSLAQVKAAMNALP